MAAKITNPDCLRGCCDAWATAKRNNIEFPVYCDRCGFNRGEDERRKQLPLTLCDDGLRRKVIPKLPTES